jgi:signal transduction histidine kinase/ActR/RegA family two-component response regulator
LLLITAALTLMIALLAARDLYTNEQRLSRSYDLRGAIEVSDQLFDASGKISIERDFSLSMLQASDAETIASLSASLEDSRQSADASVAASLAALDRVSSPELADLRRRLGERYAAIRALRPELDRAFALPRRQRDASLASRWERAATDLMDDIEQIWVGFITPFTNIDAVVSQHLRYLHMLRTITDYTGRERSIIGQILSDNGAPTTEQVSNLLRGEGVLDLSWRTSRLLAEQSSLYPAIAPTYVDAESHYATIHDMTRDMFYVPGARPRGSYPIGPDLWFELSSQASESLAVLRDVSRIATRQYLDGMIAETERTITTQAALSLIALSLCAASFWLIVARVIRPINRIVDALTRAARGEKVDFAPATRRFDEIGKLADVLEALQENVEKIRRTAVELDASKNALEDEVGVRRLAEESAQAQLERLALLHSISRAIGERQDLTSIFQTAISNVEDRLPADFACVCLYDQTQNLLSVASIGAGSVARAALMQFEEGAHVDIDENGLSQCLNGRLVYEPDLRKLDLPFPGRLAQGDLRSLVAAPLQIESTVFGMLVAARVQSDGFNSGECEFLRQLSEHVALAAHQAQLNAALQQAYDDLRQTQEAVMQQERLRALGQMASGIAHDINNALSPIALYTESLLNTEPGLSQAGYGKLEVVQRAIEDAARTIARMNEFYRKRDAALTLSPVNVNTLVQQVLDLTQARWRDMPQQRGDIIDVRTELAANLPAIMGVESELREALTNLVFNAIDAIPTGGVVTLRSRVIAARSGTGADRVQIEIADNGVGMDEDTRKRCLEPFFTTKGERGTGLGLAMVYGAIQRHGAEIEIDSTLGQGTTFYLAFAAATTHAAGTSAPAPERIRRRLRLLVIDDDPILLRSLRDVLEADGHAVTSMSDGRAGVEAVEKSEAGGKRFDAVISDLGMPGMDGRRVSAAIKAISPTMPIILLTGWGERLKAEEEMPPHVDCVLSKPPKMSELRWALGQYCTAATQKSA